MARGRRNKPKSGDGASAGAHAANTGHEAELWRMADALRGSMDAAEYKHVVLGLIFLKYISDAFEEMRARLGREQDEGADPEDPDEYRAESIFWVPPEARWSHLEAQARQPLIGRLVDDAMTAIERDNPALGDVLPKDYARPALDKQRLGQLVDMIGAHIADTFHAWRGEEGAEGYDDVPGFCKAASLEEVRNHGHVLTPGRYVGAEVQEDDGEPFEDKMKRLIAQLRDQQAEAAKLDAAVKANLAVLGYGEE